MALLSTSSFVGECLSAVSATNGPWEIDLIGVAYFVSRKIVEKEIDRSNATVPGDDKIGPA